MHQGFWSWHQEGFGWSHFTQRKTLCPSSRSSMREENSVIIWLKSARFDLGCLKLDIETPIIPNHFSVRIKYANPDCQVNLGGLNFLSPNACKQWSCFNYSFGHSKSVWEVDHFLEHLVFDISFGSRGFTWVGPWFGMHMWLILWDAWYRAQ